MDYQKLSDTEFLDLLSSEADCLPRAAVDEFVARGERMVPLLTDIVSNQFQWTRELPEWWAVVHAVFILGAIGTESVVIPLLRALRWADAFDCEWVTEALPSMLGRIRPPPVAPLKTMSADETNGLFCRSTAMRALGMIAWRHPGERGEIAKFLYSLFADAKSDLDTKKSAANVLLDIACEEYKEELLVFGREERARAEQEEFYALEFDEDDVERIFAGKDHMKTQDRDWLSFYDETEIAKRQAEDDKFSDADEPDDIDGPAKSKVGRNDPCPCGSGKKYKKCCL